MSTAQLDTQHFADISASLEHYGSKSSGPIGSTEIAYSILGALDMPQHHGTPDCDLLEKRTRRFVAGLVEINANSYAQRYYEETSFSEVDWKKGRILSPVALLKALQALRYNCDNAAWQDNHEHECLIEKLDTLMPALSAFIVSALPEYQEAAWFIASR